MLLLRIYFSKKSTNLTEAWLLIFEGFFVDFLESAAHLHYTFTANMLLLSIPPNKQ